MYFDDKEIEVEVTECGAFFCDPRFLETWQYVQGTPSTKDLPKVIQSIVNNPIFFDDLSHNLNVTTDMDSVFFHKDRFEVILDARGYFPTEIICLVKSQSVEVSAEKRNSPTGRRMCRKYSVPNPVNPHQSSCQLSSDGILVVSVPWKNPQNSYI